MGSQTTSDGSGRHDCRHGELLLRQLRDDDVDAAIEAGLMQYVPCPACDPALTAQLIEAQQRLSKAWAARERYRARNARLAHRAAEREAKRASAAPERKSALPPAAATILARAKAKAAERDKQ
ncbi:MAG TPA: hypothetical protein VIT22_02690 [Pseudoxanthomonas sp.]